MNKSTSAFLTFILIISLAFTGCTPIGNKTASITVVYIATTFFALLLLVGCIICVNKKDKWFHILFASVLIVNAGYLMLSLSTTLETALHANRIAYLGSVLLPFSMFKAIQNISKLKYYKWLNGILIGISVIVFLIAASPGWSDIYYKSVTLENVNGVYLLNKEYGSLHCIYLFYLVGYFLTMTATVLHAIRVKKIASVSHAVIILVAVFVNICVWLIEQLVKLDFEFLSISYIISEIFLLCVYLMIQNQDKLVTELKQTLNTTKPLPEKKSEDFDEYLNGLADQLSVLTPKEKELCKCYLCGKSTEEILTELNITVNTLKFHSKNLYSKLGVTSRKQLVEYAKATLLHNGDSSKQ